VAVASSARAALRFEGFIVSGFIGLNKASCFVYCPRIVVHASQLDWLDGVNRIQVAAPDHLGKQVGLPTNELTRSESRFR
jgi:hypothetical protein